jgi:hypothetical protein
MDITVTDPGSEPTQELSLDEQEAPSEHENAFYAAAAEVAKEFESQDGQESQGEEEEGVNDQEAEALEQAEGLEQNSVKDDAIELLKQEVAELRAKLEGPPAPDAEKEKLRAILPKAWQDAVDISPAFAEELAELWTRTNDMFEATTARMSEEERNAAWATVQQQLIVQRVAIETRHRMEMKRVQNEAQARAEKLYQEVGSRAVKVMTKEERNNKQFLGLVQQALGVAVVAGTSPEDAVHVVRAVLASKGNAQSQQAPQILRHKPPVRVAGVAGAPKPVGKGSQGNSGDILHEILYGN